MRDIILLATLSCHALLLIYRKHMMRLTSRNLIPGSRSSGQGQCRASSVMSRDAITIPSEKYGFPCVSGVVKYLVYPYCVGILIIGYEKRC